MVRCQREVTWLAAKCKEDREEEQIPHRHPRETLRGWVRDDNLGAYDGAGFGMSKAPSLPTTKDRGTRTSSSPKACEPIPAQSGVRSDVQGGWPVLGFGFSGAASFTVFVKGAGFHPDLPWRRCLLCPEQGHSLLTDRNFTTSKCYTI
jgi:hypothetical protein